MKIQSLDAIDPDSDSILVEADSLDVTQHWEFFPAAGEFKLLRSVRTQGVTLTRELRTIATTTATKLESEHRAHFDFEVVALSIVEEDFIANVQAQARTSRAELHAG